MFQHLIESGPRSARRSSWTIVSGGVHASVIAAAVAFTMPNAVPTVERLTLPDDLVFVPVQPPQVARPSDPTRGLPRRWPTPLDVQIDAPVVPTMIFELDRKFDPPVAAAFGNLLPEIVPAEAMPRNQVHSIRHVDREVVPLPNNPRPAYPDALRSALVEGSVLVQFVVDTTGRVEPQSISIVRATHPGFADAVRRWLPQTRYAPAEARGGRVRQLVQQVVGFTLR
jgi:protein TonB